MSSKAVNNKTFLVAKHFLTQNIFFRPKCVLTQKMLFNPKRFQLNWKESVNSLFSIIPFLTPRNPKAIGVHPDCVAIRDEATCTTKVLDRRTGAPCRRSYSLVGKWTSRDIVKWSKRINLQLFATSATRN